MIGSQAIKVISSFDYQVNFHMVRQISQNRLNPRENGKPLAERMIDVYMYLFYIVYNRPA